MGNGIAWCVNPDGTNGESWNPCAGCFHESPGCNHCWAEAFAARNLCERHRGLTKDGRWTGEVRFFPEALAQPLRRRKPTGYCVCLMGDLFHDGVTDEQIDLVFGVMARTDWHRYYVLTKRAARMERWFASRRIDLPGFRVMHFPGGACGAPWPLPNVYVGVTVEDQQRAEERIPHLLRCPARVRFLSMEPLLGPVDFHAMPPWDGLDGEPEDHLDWVIVGGESGPHARPFDLAWARSLRDQCRTAGVPFFFKQTGPHPVETRPADGAPEGVAHALARLGEAHPQRKWFRDWTLMHRGAESWWQRHPAVTGSGAYPAEWPADLRVREMPKVTP